jgi:pyruvate formate lyase activating enzyme
MAQCKICGVSSRFISAELGVCSGCIRNRPDDALQIAMQAHRRSRAHFGLPEVPPKDPAGIACRICSNECRIPEGASGYCGLFKNENGRLKGVTANKAKVSWYHDSLPTNCVADWVCPGGSKAGYPKYSYCPGPERGYTNLAVFFHACTFNCLFCQNWHFKRDTLRPGMENVSDLLSSVNERTSCICYFGGDPTPQLPFALKASRLALKDKSNRILRICWETNGSMNERLLKRMLDLSLASGGCIKFDLKARDDSLHKALTGVSNRRTYENFSRAGELIECRTDPPLLVANTLIVPGYIDEEEVRSIARFVASVNPEIPYSLLAFYPSFYMRDLPLTPRSLAEKCLSAAREEGLKNVRMGNVHLLSPG